MAPTPITLTFGFASGMERASLGILRVLEFLFHCLFVVEYIF
jgi:hypothetical protein